MIIFHKPNYFLIFVKIDTIYIHFPFCKRKCYYCDFYSCNSIEKIDSYCKFLIKEISLAANYYKNNIGKINTIFFGGGTPSLIPNTYLNNIIDTLYKTFNINKSIEFTIEVNPGTVDFLKLNEYKNFGINRISIGAQSFNNLELEFLQRIHNSQDICNTIKNSRKAGFDNINLDFIFSIPIQTIESWQANLNKIIELEIPHISAYSLIFEAGTRLYNDFQKNKITKLSEDTDAILYDTTMEFLQNNGYTHYEVSNYAKNNLKCQHNLNYWYGNNYLGLGASAHSYIDFNRFANYPDIELYQNSILNNHLPISFKEELTKKQRIIEFVFLQLRAEGILYKEFKDVFDIDIVNTVYSDCPELISENLLMINCEYLTLTNKGFLICDEIIMKLIDIIEAHIDNKV